MANRKNNSPVIWPEGHFTIEDVHAKHSTMVEITLRFRIKRALEDGILTTIGKIKPAIGRPKLVFAKANPTKELLEAATVAGVLPLVEATTTVTVMDVKSPKTEVQTPVAVEVAQTQTVTA